MISLACINAILLEPRKTTEVIQRHNQNPVKNLRWSFLQNNFTLNTPS